ncbi:PREDICTED: uncharacterized protein LOC105556962 [Vollenhovia emeryi]|uniref:uncharacterized protein LOC105556962 n=1 Tax=Vollenhovia emeryi TaxID=411798 RepID=UPI0005F4BE47|nr:PREDICTED: uncharacterized protein LOC105556962 [Vollenhovia emeryi]
MRPPSRSVEEDNEYYGPIDGARPQDHSDTYWMLLQSSCLQKIVNEPIYVSKFYSWVKLCEVCYSERQIRGVDAYELKENYHAITSRLHRLTWEHKTGCIRCKKELMWVRPAHQCRDCIEEYLVKEDMFNIRENARMNYETETIKRY